MYRCLKNVIHQIDRNGCFDQHFNNVFSKLRVGFSFKTGKRFSLEVSKPTEKA